MREELSDERRRKVFQSKRHIFQREASSKRRIASGKEAFKWKGSFQVERKLEVTSKFFPGGFCVSVDVKIEYSTVEQEAFGILLSLGWDNLHSIPYHVLVNILFLHDLSYQLKRL